MSGSPLRAFATTPAARSAHSSPPRSRTAAIKLSPWSSSHLQKFRARATCPSKSVSPALTLSTRAGAMDIGRIEFMLRPHLELNGADCQLPRVAPERTACAAATVTRHRNLRIIQGRTFLLVLSIVFRALASHPGCCGTVKLCSYFILCFFSGGPDADLRGTIWLALRKKSQPDRLLEIRRPWFPASVCCYLAGLVTANSVGSTGTAAGRIRHEHVGNIGPFMRGDGKRNDFCLFADMLVGSLARLTIIHDRTAPRGSEPERENKIS